MEDIREEFRTHEDGKKAISMSCYMRDQFSFYGLPSPLRKTIEKPYIKEAKAHFSWAYLDSLYEDPHRECQYFVMDVLKGMKKKLTYDDIEHIKGYILDRSWWDVNDELVKVIGAIGLKEERVKDLMLTWSVSEEMWLRRVSILHQLAYKEKTDVVVLERVIRHNLSSDEFFINKAIGWALRDYSKTNPAFVSDLLKKYDFASLSVKEASKYLQ
jgi:3-methyladenine DNA glycosylase AlkD